VAQASKQTARRAQPRRPSRGASSASVTAATPFPPSTRAAISRRLLAWFRKHGRDLPWRQDAEPYRVWVSEIMLQQTQVERVCEYFRRFLKAFPTVAALAEASEADVLAAWQGLGYYRRARQLHACAQRIVAEHAGRFPSTVAELSTLPGIGRYTASAIASIAFGKPEPIVEANSRRVLARLVGYDQPLGGTAADGPIWEIAAAFVPARQAGLFNQALMDLGAMICRPAAASCSACPLSRHCVAYRDGRTDELPRMARARPSVAIEEVALLAVHGGRLLLVQRGEAEWWAGLWDVPRAAGPHGPIRRAAARDGRLLGEVRYGVTHHRVRVDVVQLPADVAAAAAAGATASAAALGLPLASQPVATAWVPLSRLATLAMPSPARRIIELLKRQSPPDSDH
jgi:A/G-specific adenine glycosylase